MASNVNERKERAFLAESSKVSTGAPHLGGPLYCLLAITSDAGGLRTSYLNVSTGFLATIQFKPAKSHFLILTVNVAAAD